MKAKTLIISGTYQHTTHPVILGVRHTVIYDVTLYGQTPESPEVQYITSFKMDLNGYDELQEVSRAYFARYFKTDLFNIISMDNLNKKAA